MLKNKKILILGGSGFVGKNLLSKINLYENSVTIISRKNFVSKAKLIIADLIIDTDKLKKLFIEYDIIFNCSGELSNEDKMNELHVKSLSKIIDFLSKFCLKNHRKIRWIQVSSIGVYGFDKKKALIDENSEKNPSNYYEKTKLSSEKIIINGANAYFEYIILRPSTIYGRGMKSDFIQKISQYLKKKIFFYINSKDSLFNLIHIDDLSKALILCSQDQVKNEDFNLSCNYELKEIIKIICILKNVKEPKIVINEKIIRYLVKFLNIFINLPLNQRIIDILISQRDFKIDKIKNHLGFEPHTKLYNGLKDVLDNR